MIRLSGSKDSSPKTTEHHITFSSSPFDSPSSPPPTSPLPPVPEIAPYNHGFPASISLPAHSVPTTGRPIRPPRPQTCLPDLKPRIMTSPGRSQRQRHPEVAAQVRLSPTPTGRRRRTLRDESENPGQKIPLHLGSIRLLSPTLHSGSTFSDEVLCALPRLFDRLSPVHSSDHEPVRHAEPSERIEPWRVYHESLVKAPSKPTSQRRATKKPVARTALFIPETSQQESSQVDPHAPIPGICPSRRSEPCYITQSQQRSRSASTTSNKWGPWPMQQPRAIRKSHKRSPAVTSFAFNSGNYSTSGTLLSATEGIEDLTSLPRMPSDSIMLVNNTFDKTTEKKSMYLRSEPLKHNRNHIGGTTFAALPYSQTLQSAGPKPKTERDISVRHEDMDHDIEAEEGEARHPTEYEIRKAKQMKVLWVVATITLVAIATAGILISIIWKLRALD